MIALNLHVFTSQRRSTIATFCSLLLLCTLALPARAQPQSSGPPAWLVNMVDDLRLGVRLEGGVVHSRLSLAPLEERGMRYLGQAVRDELSPVTTPLYGVEAGVRWASRGGLFGVYRLNAGLGPETTLRFQNGGQAIPATYDVRQWEVRAHYFVQGNVGLGAVYRDELVLLIRNPSFTVMGQKVDEIVFSGRSDRRNLSLYVPMRFRLGNRTTLFGRVGASVYGRSDGSYNTRFTYYQDPEHPNELFPLPINDENISIDAKNRSLNRQFVRIGIERPLFGTKGRLFVQAERVSVGDVSEEWRGGVRMQLGLPF